MTARYRCPVLKAEIIRPTREDARDAFACVNCRSMKCNGPENRDTEVRM